MDPRFIEKLSTFEKSRPLCSASLSVFSIVKLKLFKLTLVTGIINVVGIGMLKIFLRYF